MVAITIIIIIIIIITDPHNNHMRDLLLLLPYPYTDKKLRHRKVKHCPQATGIVCGEAGISIQIVLTPGNVILIVQPTNIYSASNMLQALV